MGASRCCAADGSQYELGPFSTPLEAAQAHDRYSLLLKGAAAETNFPYWCYLAPENEVQVGAKAASHAFHRPKE